MRRRDKRKRIKKRTAREAEVAVIGEVRQRVLDRDKDCRFPVSARWMMPCNFAPTGEPEWAHRDGWRRARTVGQDPAARHTTAGSMMLCKAHHLAYDYGEISDLAEDVELGADGKLKWFTKLGELLGVS